MSKMAKRKTSNIPGWTRRGDHPHPPVRSGRTGGATREDAPALCDAVLQCRFLPSGPDVPDAVVVSDGGNALTSRPAPQQVREDVPSLIAAVADGLRWLITCLGLNGAPEATVTLITTVPGLG